MPKRKEPELDPKEQFKRFQKAARESEVDPRAAEQAFASIGRVGKLGMDEIIVTPDGSGWRVGRYGSNGDCFGHHRFEDKKEADAYAAAWEEKCRN